MSKKVLKASCCGVPRRLRFMAASYTKTGNLAIKSFDAETGVLLEDVTVKTSRVLKPTFAYINTKSFPEAMSVLEGAGIAKSLGEVFTVKGHDYPLAEFNMGKLREYLA